jgi:hypothetical protein
MIFRVKRQAEMHILFKCILAKYMKYFEHIRLDKELDYGYLRRLSAVHSTASTSSMITSLTGQY